MTAFSPYRTRNSFAKNTAKKRTDRVLFLVCLGIVENNSSNTRRYRVNPSPDSDPGTRNAVQKSDKLMSATAHLVILSYKRTSPSRDPVQSY